MQIKSISLSSCDQTMEGGSGKRFPVKLKDLLATGILEGLKVRYVKGHKVYCFELLILVLFVKL